MGMRSGLFALAALAMLLLAMGADASARNAGRPQASDDTSNTVLYLGGSSALALTLPDAAGSVPIPARVGGPLVWQVGIWKSQPVGTGLDYAGNFSFSLWASSSSPGQLNTYFQVYIGVNDARGPVAYNSDRARLSSTPKEFKGTGTAQIVLNPGDMINFWVYASERGPGGDLLFGGSTPSSIEMALQAVNINLTVVNSPGQLKIAGNVTDIWGPGDVAGITLAVLGPFEEQNGSGRELYGTRTKLVKEAKGDQVATEEDSEGQMVFSYTWRFDAAAMSTGSYMVMALVETQSNMTADAQVWTPIVQPKPGFFGSSPILIVALAALAVVMVAVLVFLLMRKGKLSGLLANRKAMAALAAVGLITVAAVGLFVTLAPAQSTDRAPAFTLADVNGKKVSLEDLEGSVVILDMMATWCPTCNQEIPQLQDFHGKHPDVVLISIDVDRTENAQKLKEHMQAKGASWILCMDTDSILQKYKATEIPKLVVINPSGYITFMKSGLVSSDQLSQEAARAQSGSAPILSLGSETGFALLAFIAGMSAFLSPCAFPLLPGYMSYYIGREEKGATDRRMAMRKAIIGGLMAAAGILVVYSLLGLATAAAGDVVRNNVGTLQPIVAAVIIIMGVVMLTNYVIPFYKVTAPLRPVTDSVGRGFRRLTARGSAGEQGEYAGLFSYGAGYGAASLGCHAPIFIALVMGALGAGTFADAMFVFIMYAVGMGLLMIAVTVMVGMTKTELVKKMVQWMPTIKKISGVVLIIVGAVLIYLYLFPATFLRT
jgi:cytochrome c-type biogenesis protein